VPSEDREGNEEHGGRLEAGSQSTFAGSGWKAPAAAEPAELVSRPPQAPATHAAAGSTIVGEARGVRERHEPHGSSRDEIVWTFRVERHDQLGNRLPPVSVEMRGYRFDGALQDGDWVELDGQAQDGTLRARSLRNLTTGSQVRAHGTPLAAKLIVAAIAVVVLAVFLVIGVSIVSHS
jgi:hypothetical protein